MYKKEKNTTEEQIKQYDKLSRRIYEIGAIVVLISFVCFMGPSRPLLFLFNGNECEASCTHAMFLLIFFYIRIHFLQKIMGLKDEQIYCLKKKKE